MNYPFVTFTSLDGQNRYSICVKRLVLNMKTLQKSDISYYIRFDLITTPVSRETYEEVENIMIECNRKFEREFPAPSFY